MNNPITSFPYIHLCETDSTNNYLKTICKDRHPKEFTTILADYQTNGHGQENNIWESENDKNLLFSFILYPNFCQARQQFYLSQLISIAVKEALDQYTTGFFIKWPNDIYWNEKKICGILIENDLYGTIIEQSIIGIGLNINQIVFKSNAPNPISLAQITNKKYNIQIILTQIISLIRKYYHSFQDGNIKEIKEHYFNALYRKNGFHLYKDYQGEFSARIIDILPTGTLVLIDKSGKKRNYNFKEVSFLQEE